MRVFLSSMRRGLVDERDQLATLLTAVGHQVVRFEDFGARASTPRAACLEALASADVCVLLLGPHYGDPSLDSGIPPTEEEFTAARVAGKPMLVYIKRNVTHDAAQADFTSRVSDYVDGQYRDEFDDYADLGHKVVAALRTVTLVPPEPRWLPMDPIVYQSLHASTSRGQLGAPSYGSVLEVHLLMADPVGIRSASGRDQLAAELMQRMRSSGLVGPGDPVNQVDDRAGVHVHRPSQPSRSSGAMTGARTDPYRGIRVGADGSVCAYMMIDGDMLGSLTDDADLTQRLVRLLELAVEYVPSDASRVAVAACIIDEGRTSIGDPALLATRTASVAGWGRPNVVLPADRVVARTELVGSPLAVAREVAARLLIELGTRGMRGL